MKGLVLNYSRPDLSRVEDRLSDPALYLDDGSPVFEFWHWHVELEQWFVMTRDLRFLPGGVVCYTPDQLPRLRRLLVAMGKARGLL